MPIALLAALAGSFALHAAALFLPDVELSSLPEPIVLRAELQPPPKPPGPAVEESKPLEPPAEARPLPKPRKARPPSPRPLMVPQAEAGVPASEPSAAVPGSEAMASGEKPGGPPRPKLPARGKIRFLVYKGSQGFEVGRAEHVWDFAEDGSYRLTSVTETSGLAAFFKPVRMELESSGRLTAGGLQPGRFTTRKNGHETNENADFDWQARQVNIQREGIPRPLADGAQDLLSFHYQLAYLGRLADGVSMGVASGKKYERYAFDALGEEILETPAGSFRTLHLRVQTDSTTELWLAIERMLLPVKMRYTDRKGDSFEQIVTEIGM